MIAGRALGLRVALSCRLFRLHPGGAQGVKLSLVGASRSIAAERDDARTHRPQAPPPSAGTASRPACVPKKASSARAYSS